MENLRKLTKEVFPYRPNAVIKWAFVTIIGLIVFVEFVKKKEGKKNSKEVSLDTPSIFFKPFDILFFNRQPSTENDKTEIEQIRENRTLIKTQEQNYTFDEMRGKNSDGKKKIGAGVVNEREDMWNNFNKTIYV